MTLRFLLGVLITLPLIADDCLSPSVGYRVLHIQSRTVAVWFPTNAAPAPYAYGPTFSSTVALDAPPSPVCGKRVPLVVFSHGDLGCGLQFIPFTEELARHGYVVAAPDHADASFCHIDPKQPPPPHRPAQPNFFKPDTWNDMTFAGRRDDLEAVLDGLLADRDFRPVVDPQRIGAAGHSLGGYTVVAMAGAWPSWRDPRIHAVLAMSPYVLPFQVHNTLQNVHVPLMYQGGTLDLGITPFLIQAKGAYWQSNPPVYFVDVNLANHFTWAGCGKEKTTAACLQKQFQVRVIDEYGVAFFNRYLKSTSEPILERKDPALADYKFRLTGQ